ncbi:MULTISPECIES: response regulator [Spirosoma]|uniref:Response regulator n=1 Tax=Spirosoma liriopis TaxID=2937440 RepID=A0ABT0HFP3_9BACT|nr:MULTISPECIES: response regulator [Spirosoma]MCK8490969.1 response regulator [Spirosoma liriopis]UHG90353.1 response regulator [Spirosoma oryzicola]
MPILVVEDNADQWLIIRSALAQCFPEVEPIWVNNPMQALKYLESCLSDETKLPRLILLDLYLPRREDSWILLEAIKSNSVYRQVPIVVLSGSQDHDDVVKSYTFSIASYIVKPITYHQWLTCFYTFRRYWWESVTLPQRSLKSSV